MIKIDFWCGKILPLVLKYPLSFVPRSARCSSALCLLFFKVGQTFRCKHHHQNLIQKTFLTTFPYRSITLCLFICHEFLHKKTQKQFNYIEQMTNAKIEQRSRNAYAFRPIRHLFLSITWCEIYQQRSKSLDRKSRQFMGPKSLDRKSRGNCGEYELSKEAGFRKSLWVLFLVLQKILFLIFVFCIIYYLMFLLPGRVHYL